MFALIFALAARPFSLDSLPVAGPVRYSEQLEGFHFALTAWVPGSSRAGWLSECLVGFCPSHVVTASGLPFCGAVPEGGVCFPSLLVLLLKCLCEVCYSLSFG